MRFSGSNIAFLFYMFWICLNGFLLYTVSYSAAANDVINRPEMPDFPVFGKSMLDKTKKNTFVKPINDVHIENLAGMPKLPNAWVFLTDFKITEERAAISKLELLRKLGAPVFLISCNRDKSVIKLQVGPYFDAGEYKDPKEVLRPYIARASSLEDKRVLRRMKVESYDPVNCYFLHYS